MIEGAALFGLTIGVTMMLKSPGKKPKSPIYYTRNVKQHNKPFPPEMITMLNRCHLCVLSTYLAEPHLALMHYTFCKEDNLIILCTKVLTKKYLQFINSPEVSFMIHDFPQVRFGDSEVPRQFTQTMAVGVNGIIQVCKPGSPEEAYYRKLHIEKNPFAAQFIVDDDDHHICVLTPQKARFCDINDRLVYWNTIEGVTFSDTMYYNHSKSDVS